MKKRIVVLTGAGVSAESGLKTFRDANGLWEGHNVMEVASPEGFSADPALVLDFYNQRRRQLLGATPNKAHTALVLLEDGFHVDIVTQNVDDLHERAGSTSILHIHGELFKVRSTIKEQLVLPWKKDLCIGDLCEYGSQLRPHIVWFGEQVPLLEEAAKITQRADMLIIIGTSMQVYPAASLVDYVSANAPIYFIDPKPAVRPSDFRNLRIIKKTAADGVPKLVDELIRSLE